MVQAKLVLVFVLVGCSAGGATPHLDSVSPAAIAPGGLVMVTGEHLCGDPPDCQNAGGEFELDSSTPVRLQTTTYTDTAAQLQIPSIAPVGMSTLVLTVNDTSSNGLTLEVVVP
jgi:hypothetical protein